MQTNIKASNTLTEMLTILHSKATEERKEKIPFSGKKRPAIKKGANLRWSKKKRRREGE